MNSIKWFNFFLTMAAILVAILDFSNCSRISSWYPPDIRSRDTKYIKSSEKKTLTVNAGYRCLAAWLILSRCLRRAHSACPAMNRSRTSCNCIDVLTSANALRASVSSSIANTDGSSPGRRKSLINWRLYSPWISFVLSLDLPGEP